MYCWLKWKFHKSDRQNLMAFPFPLEHDNMPIKGYPMKYRLTGGWTIPKQDLIYLSDGPLVTSDFQDILVSHELGREWFKSQVKLWWAPVGVIGTLFAVAQGVVWLVGMF